MMFHWGNEDIEVMKPVNFQANTAEVRKNSKIETERKGEEGQLASIQLDRPVLLAI